MKLPNSRWYEPSTKINSSDKNIIGCYREKLAFFPDKQVQKDILIYLIYDSNCMTRF